MGCRSIRGVLHKWKPRTRVSYHKYVNYTRLNHLLYIDSHKVEVQAARLQHEHRRGQPVDIRSILGPLCTHGTDLCHLGSLSRYVDLRSHNRKLAEHRLDERGEGTETGPDEEELVNFTGVKASSSGILERQWYLDRRNRKRHLEGHTQMCLRWGGRTSGFLGRARLPHNRFSKERRTGVEHGTRASQLAVFSAQPRLPTLC